MGPVGLSQELLREHRKTNPITRAELPPATSFSNAPGSVCHLQGHRGLQPGGQGCVLPWSRLGALRQATSSAVTVDCFSQPLPRSEKQASRYLRLMHMYLWTFKEAPCRNAYLVAKYNVFYCPCRSFCNILWKFTLEEVSKPVADPASPNGPRLPGALFNHSVSFKAVPMGEVARGDACVSGMHNYVHY